MARMNEAERLLALTQYERPLWEQGLLVGGMDEAGRGPLAGPVVAACVLLRAQDLIEGVNDSKKLSQKRREALYEQIREQAVSYGVGVVGEKEIDEINILQATRKAFALAYEAMDVKPTHLLVDAVEGLAIDAQQIPIIKGDAKSYLIGAASIIAKVTRDRMMHEMHERYPQYGFDAHKGYGTAAHVAAIREYGPCELHRRSFLKKIWAQA